MILNKSGNLIWARRGACLLLSILLLAVASLLGACPNGKGRQGGSDLPQEHVALEQGGSISLPLTIAPDEPVLKELDLSDPALFALARCIELPVMRALPDGSVAPGAASACSSNDGGRTYVLTLATAPGHEGEPAYLGTKILERWQELLRGEDSPLKAQLSDLLTGGLDYALGQGESITGLSLEGGSLTVTLTRPYQLFPLWLSQPGLGVLENRRLPSAGGAEPAAGGYGPFVVASMDKQTLTLKPNPESLLGQPLLDSLTFVCEPDRLLQIELFRAGRLDAANVPMLTVPDIEADTVLSPHLTKNNTASQILCSFDHHQFPWGDQAFQPKTGLRESLNWGLSREGLVEVFNEQFSAWPHFLPQTMSDAVDPALISNPLHPNHPQIEEARAAQKEADHEQGGKLLPGMDVAYLRGSDLDQLADEILRYWNEVSVKMEPFPVTRAELRTRLDLGSTEIVLERIVPAYPDPDACFYPALYGPLAYRNGRGEALIGTGGNHSLLSDRVIDRLIVQAQAEPDRQVRTKLYQSLGKVLEERAMFVFVGTATPSLLIAPRLGGYALNPFDFDASLPSQDFSKLGIKAGAGGEQVPKQANAAP